MDLHSHGYTVEFYQNILDPILDHILQQQQLHIHGSLEGKEKKREILEWNYSVTNEGGKVNKIHTIVEMMVIVIAVSKIFIYIY